MTDIALCFLNGFDYIFLAVIDVAIFVAFIKDEQIWQRNLLRRKIDTPFASLLYNFSPKQQNPATCRSILIPCILWCLPIDSESFLTFLFLYWKWGKAKSCQTLQEISFFISKMTKSCHLPQHSDPLYFVISANRFGIIPDFSFFYIENVTRQNPAKLCRKCCFLLQKSLGYNFVWK